MYVTVQGDTFDLIAKKVYGSETFTDLLMKNNPDSLSRVVFTSGITLNTPEIETVNNNLPPWRQ